MYSDEYTDLLTRVEQIRSGGVSNPSELYALVRKIPALVATIRQLREGKGQEQLMLPVG